MSLWCIVWFVVGGICAHYVGNDLFGTHRT